MKSFNFDTASKQEVRDLFCNHDVNGMEFVLESKKYILMDETGGSKARMCAPYYLMIFEVEDESGEKLEMNICEKLGIVA